MGDIFELFTYCTIHSRVRKRSPAVNQHLPERSNRRERSGNMTAHTKTTLKHLNYLSQRNKNVPSPFTSFMHPHNSACSTVSVARRHCPLGQFAAWETSRFRCDQCLTHGDNKCRHQVTNKERDKDKGVQDINAAGKVESQSLINGARVSETQGAGTYCLTGSMWV